MFKIHCKNTTVCTQIEGQRCIQIWGTLAMLDSNFDQTSSKYYKSYGRIFIETDHIASATAFN